jgi:hypothetical protein
MKTLYTTTMLTFALICGASSLLLAQDSNTSQYGNGTLESQNDQQEEADLDVAIGFAKPTGSKADSISFKLSSIKTKPAAEIQKSVKVADEDVLSFNFLYYIIQRFKSSDIIED